MFFCGLFHLTNVFFPTTPPPHTHLFRKKPPHNLLQASPTIAAIALHLCARHDAPGTDDVVSVAGEQSLAVGAPGKGHALGVASVLVVGDGEVGLELVNLGLLLEVEDDDAGGSGSAEPVAVGREDEGVDLIVGVQGVEVLGLVKVPQHGSTILATRGAQGSIGGDGDGVDVAGVADVISLQLAGGELPDLFRECQRKSTASNSVCDCSRSS